MYKSATCVTSPLPQKVGIVESSPSRIANALPNKSGMMDINKNENNSRLFDILLSIPRRILILCDMMFLKKGMMRGPSFTLEVRGQQKLQ